MAKRGLSRSYLLRYLYAYTMVLLLFVALSGLFFGFTCERTFNYQGLILGPLYLLPMTYKFVVPLTMIVTLPFVSFVKEGCWSSRASILRLLIIPPSIYVVFSTLLLLMSLAKPQTDCF